VDALLQGTVRRARARRLIPQRAWGAVDSTGYEARQVSSYFVWVAGRRARQRRWPKLTAVLETHSHIFLSARVTRGPSQDAPHLRPAARAAVAHTPLDTLLGDGAYDSEANHACAREQLGIRATVIPLNRRGNGRKRPKTKYRRQMVRRFRKKPRGSRYRRVYGQRWQVESGFSRSKRRLGSALRAVLWPNQKKEIQMRVLTHNVMLLAA
jgi:hypothetical protein